MKFPNKVKVWSLWTDWNRKGARGQYGGIGWYRIINPLEKLDNSTVNGEFAFGSENRIEIAKEIGEKADVMVIKYVDSFAAANHILTIRDVLGIKLLVDIDDNVFEVHPHNYAYKDTNKDTEAYKVFGYLFSEADGLICSTEPLAEYMRRYNPNVTVIQNAVDPAIWDVPVVKNDTDRVKIGWVYGPTHAQDVPVMLPVVKEIIKKYPNVDFYHIGWKDADFDHFDRQHTVFGTNGYKEFPEFLAGLGMDILVAPLIDDEFNKSKSNIKWMEAAMCEIPMVASAVAPYSDSITHGKDGMLAKTTREWIASLSGLIDDKQKRVKMGQAAKKNVLAKYSIEKILPKYVKLFEAVTKPEPAEVTAVITRRKGESDGKALESLKRQTYRKLKIIRIEDSDGNGQNWAKNRGLERVKTKYTLFSDNDVTWKLDAVQSLLRALKRHPEASYAFGAYIWNFEGSAEKHIQCNEPWSAERLKALEKGNIVSTMALVKTADCPPMDESVKRLTDWDLWLTMLGQGKTGVHCGKITFETEFAKNGVSASKATSYDEAIVNLKKKHNL